MAAFHANNDVPGADRERIRMLSDRLLFMRDETTRDNLREHLRSEIFEARRQRTARSVVDPGDRRES
jgi:hypothetical protein